jgi:hypothetical protein
MKSPSTLGVVAGMLVAFVILAALAFMLLKSDGANYKVLVAVWLWLLPVTGVFAGIGYAAGRVVEVFLGAKNQDEEGVHADD